MARGDVPVEIRAHAFEQFGRPLTDAWISVRERPGLRLCTGRDGRVRLTAEVGSTLTAMVERARYVKIQTATVVVPADGMVGADRALTLQVPLALTFALLRRVLARPRPGCHHIATTITAAGKTLADSPQGEPGAQIELRRAGGGACGDRPIYLGAVPWIHKTDFGRALLSGLGLVAPLEQSSVDGGVLIANVPRGRYTLTAHKLGRRFTRAEVVIDEQSPLLINVSPPHGPRVLAG